MWDKDIDQQRSVSLARSLTQTSASTAAWRMRNNHARRMAAVAREWMEHDGYMRATATEMARRYGDLFDAGTSFGEVTWCVFTGLRDRNGRVDFHFARV